MNLIYTTCDAGPCSILDWCGDNIVGIVVVGYQDIVIYLFLIALETVQLGLNILFQLHQIVGGVLYLCSPLAWWIKVLHLPLLLPLVVVSTGLGSLLL